MLICPEFTDYIKCTTVLDEQMEKPIDQSNKSSNLINKSSLPSKMTPMRIYMSSHQQDILAVLNITQKLIWLFCDLLCN